MCALQLGGMIIHEPTVQSLGFQRPLKEWSRSLDCFLPKDRFLRLALNIQKITVFVAQELLRVSHAALILPAANDCTQATHSPACGRIAFKNRQVSRLL